VLVVAILVAEVTIRELGHIGEDMTHEERERYAQRLMAVLEGEAPGITVTESGELEAVLPTVATIPPNFCPWRWLTGADRRDRAAL
jgi:hypothetical protein